MRVQSRLSQGEAVDNETGADTGSFGEGLQPVPSTKSLPPIRPVEKQVTNRLPVKPDQSITLYRCETQ